MPFKNRPVGPRGDSYRSAKWLTRKVTPGRADSLQSAPYLGSLDEDPVNVLIARHICNNHLVVFFEARLDFDQL